MVGQEVPQLNIADDIAYGDFDCYGKLLAYLLLVEEIPLGDIE